MQRLNGRQPRLCGWTVADEPLDEPDESLYWASDHTGVQADIGLGCE